MKLKKFNEMAENTKDFELIPILDASDFPNDVEDELAGNEISTHYSNDVLRIWKWEENEWPLFQQWLLDTYGEKARQYKSFAIMGT